MRIQHLVWPVLALLVGCAGVPVNPPKNHPQSGHASVAQERGATSENVVALSFSGGGLRAAGFSFGVLEGLRAQRSSNGRTLLDEVRFVSSVSGGSLTAAYLGLHGAHDMQDFRSDVLLSNGEAGLRLSLFSLSNLQRLLSGGINDRSDFSSWLENDVFKGARFSDMSGDAKPEVWIAATNLQYRVAFPFHQRAFDALCSDLASYPVSEAVAASMAVPLLFAPAVLQRFPDACTVETPPGLKTSQADEDDDHHRLRRAFARYYADLSRPGTGRYLKLVDGGLTDNLGLVSILQTRLLLNTPYGPIPLRDALTMKRLLFVVVDAGQAASTDWGKEVSGPSALVVAEGAIDTAIESTMRMSYAGFKSLIRDWERDVIHFRCGLSPETQAALKSSDAEWRCDDVKFAITQISFSSLSDGDERDLNAIPTRLSLPAEQIDKLVSAGKRAVATDPRVRGFTNAIRPAPP